MAYTLSPYDPAVTTMSPHTSTPNNARRFSRSYSSQTSTHPYRVEKPRSNHNSPHTAERRRTTTGAKLYATLDDHYNMMMGLTSDEAAMEDVPEPSIRPVSWHPSSGHFQVSRPTHEINEPVDYSRHYPESCRNSVHGSDFYSMSARNSSYFEPAQSLQNLPAAHESHRGSQDSDNSWPTQTYSQSSFSTPATDPMPWYLQEWARKNQAQSQQGSADFLPIQHPTEQEEPAADEDMEDSGKELVGMGLYDLPDSSLQWGSLQGEGTGKGLKLEETWQPPEEEDDDEEDAGEGEEEEEEGDDASSENDEEELPPPPAPQPPAERLPVQADLKSQTPGSMEGQSFFFDEDESITKEWWYPQLRQPTVPVRDAGIGYGWL